MWTPSQPSDHDDDNPSVIAHTVRALQAEVRSGFELITQKVLDRLDRFDGRLDAVIDRQNLLEQSHRRITERLVALEAVSASQPSKPRKK